MLIECIKKTNKNERINVVVSFIICVLYAFTVSQVDCNTITGWARNLLDCLFNGELGRFPEYTYYISGVPSNYSLFDNTITAIGIAPLYVLERIVNGSFSYIIYDIWYKAFILVICIFDLFLFCKVLSHLQFEHKRIIKGIIYYLISAVVCIAVVGKGQIDIYALTFVLLGIICFMKEEYIRMSLFMGLALIVKPFVILVIVPFYLLMLYRLKSTVIINSIITLIPFIVDTTITKSIMPNYEDLKNVTSQMYKESFGLSRVEQLFNIHINNVIVFFAVALIICFITFRIGRKREALLKDYLFYPSLMYIAYGIFVSSSCYWFIIIVPALIVMGLKFKNENDFELLYFGSNIGVVIYIYFLEKDLRPGTNFTIFDLLGMCNIRSQIYNTLSDYRVYAYELGATVFLVCMLLICVVYYRESTSKEVIKTTDNKTNKKNYFIIQYVPVIMYLLINYATIRWK